MDNPIQGLIHITGEPDTGKTTFALSTGYAPEEICFFDDDLKTQAIANMLAEQGRPFGAYYNLAKLSLNKRELDFHDLVMGLIDQQPRNKFKALIFDTWTRFENTFQPVVQSNPNRFKQFFSPMGSIKGAEIWKASFDYEMVVIDRLLELAPLVILITHLKDQTIGSVKTGKQVPDCKKPVVEKSRLRLWLRHNPDGPAPIGLVLKRLGKVEVGAGIQTVNVLPRKLNPCTWETIMRYWQNPIGNTQPSDKEIPNDFELSILDGVLTEDQKDILRVNRMTLETEKQETEKSANSAYTLEGLLEKFEPAAIMEANGGKIPATQDEIEAVFEKLSARAVTYEDAR